MRKTILALSILALAAFLVSFTIHKVQQPKEKTTTQLSVSATCYGSKNCNACKNCKYCKHCAKDGGTCGVCK